MVRFALGVYTSTVAGSPSASSSASPPAPVFDAARMRCMRRSRAPSFGAASTLCVCSRRKVAVASACCPYGAGLWSDSASLSAWLSCLLGPPLLPAPLCCHLKLELLPQTTSGA